MSKNYNIDFKHSNPLNLDANEQIFLSRQLNHIIAEMFKVEYAELKDREMIPVSYEVPSGALTYSYRMYDKVGLAKVVHSYANDFPRVDILGQEYTGKIRSLGDGYGYNVQEIRAAAMAGGMNLDMERGLIAKEAMMQLENQIAFYGSSADDLNGLFSDPNVTNTAVATDGAGGSGLWSTKTPDQIIRDIRDARSAMIALTKGREVPNTLLLPSSQHGVLSGTMLGTSGSVTILSFIKNNFPDIVEISWLNELAGSGTGSTDQFILYRKDPRKLRLIIPQDFEQFPAQLKGLDYEVPCHMRLGGVMIPYPLSISKVYGI